MRRVNWPELLDAQIRASSTKEFCFGQHDCALFVADCIHAMTGHDPAASFRGTYSDKDGADLALLNYAGGDLAAFAYQMAGECGYAACPIAYAQRGDVALCAMEEGHSLGIVAMNGRDVLIAAPQGLLAHPIARAVAVWRVA